MKEWNGTELEKEENRNLSVGNQFDNALVVISNLIARATTKWTIEETKLFLCSVSEIKKRDENNWVILSKKDVAEKLEIDRTNRPKMRDMFKKMMTKSWIAIDGPTDEEWDDGFLITRIRSDKKYIYVKFESSYVPLLDQLSSHFTEFYIDYVKDFKRLSSYNLYVYLTSWYDPNYLIQNKKIAKKELAQIFNLKEGEYWRNYGKEKAFFDWKMFETRVLNPAVEEINLLNSCDMHIDSVAKVKKSRNVLGYDIKYSFIDESGTRK